jgi:hypothetical protein
MFGHSGLVALRIAPAKTGEMRDALNPPSWIETPLRGSFEQKKTPGFHRAF